MKNSENTKFPKKVDLFLSTGLFDEKTLEKIGNGNFGIVFKVKLERNINLGRNDHTVIKTVAVKDTFVKCVSVELNNTLTKLTFYMTEF